jgi:CRP-like cAMP-binding protein
VRTHPGIVESDALAFSHRGNNGRVNAENPWARESRRLNRLFAAELARCMAPQPLQHVQVGQQLLRFGETPLALPWVEAGGLDAVVPLGDDGQRVVPVSFQVGEIAMCSNLFSQQGLGADIVAAQDSVVRWLPRVAVEAAVQQHSVLMLALLKFLAQRLREVQARERVWMARGVRARLWATLTRECGQAQAPAGCWRVTLTHEQLAERAGVSRPKLSQALKVMESEGLLRLGRGFVDVLSLTVPGR